MSYDSSRLVKKLYQKTRKHTSCDMEVDLIDHNVDRDSIKIDGKDMPFFRVALVNRHLDEVE